MQLRTGCLGVTTLVIGLSARPAPCQTPVFQDLLTDASRITGQWGSGLLSVDGYTLTQSGGTGSTGHPGSRYSLLRKSPFLGCSLLGRLRQCSGA